MKILTLEKPNSETAKKVTVDFWVDEDEAGQPIKQIMLPHYNPVNSAFVRQLLVTNNYITVSKFGLPTVGFHVDDLVQLLYTNFPEISFAPKLANRLPQEVLVKEGEAAEIKAAFISELPVSYQWQQYNGTDWADVANANTNAISAKEGTYRLLAKNEKGETVTQPIVVKTNKPLTLKADK